MGQQKRQCPALCRDITSAECGESRVSRITCTENCSHNPWGPKHYSQASMIEELIYDELNRHLFQKAPELYRSLPDTDTMQRMAALIHATLVQRDAEGLTFLQRWERTGWKGLNNDQTVLIKALAKQKVAILEVLEVLNDEETRVRDRLDLARPPFIIRDQSLTGQVGRFTTSVSLIYEMPYYTRVNGVAALIPILNGLEAEEVIRSIALHQGVQAEGESLREWMLANYGLVAKSCEALHGAVQDAMAKNAKFTRISYQLTVPRHVFAKAMDTHPEVISNSPTVGGHTDDKTHEWAWKADPEPHMHGKIPVLGRVICNAQGVQLEAGGAKRIAALRNAFESFTGEMVRFHGQRVDDVGAQLRNRAPNAVDYTLVPPSLMASMPQLETSVYLVSEEQFQSTNGNAQKLAKTIQDWCHTPIPAFAGKKPTEASQDPLLRPKLILMVKQMIAEDDLRGLNGSPWANTAQIAEELGLDELIFPAPQELLLKAMVQESPEDLPRLAPPLPQKPLTFDDIENRLQATQDYFNNDFADLVNTFTDEAEDLTDWLRHIMAKDYSENEFQFMELLFARLWFVVYPPQYEPRVLDMPRFIRACQGLIENLEVVSDWNIPASQFTSVSQPYLCQFGQTTILSADKFDAFPVKFKAEQQVFLSLIIKILVDELDLSARE